jgi:hypothetical protein
MFADGSYPLWQSSPSFNWRCSPLNPYRRTDNRQTETPLQKRTWVMMLCRILTKASGSVLRSIDSCQRERQTSKTIVWIMRLCRHVYPESQLRLVGRSRIGRVLCHGPCLQGKPVCATAPLRCLSMKVFDMNSVGQSSRSREVDQG